MLPRVHLWRISTGGGAYAPAREDLFGAIVPGLWADPGRDVQTRPRCARGRGWLMSSIVEDRCFREGSKMTKKELAARVADKAQLTNRQAETIVGIFLTCVAEALREGDKVELRGFGSFRTRSRKARRGRNPRTGDAIQVPAKKVPFFAAGEVLRKKVASAERGETEVVLCGSPGKS